MIWFWVLWAIVLTFGIVVFRGAPYVPSRRRYIKHAFSELYPLSKKDVLVDVGSGDGIVLRVASECGAKAIGYELNPILVVVARFLSRGNKNVRATLTDFWLAKLPNDVTIVYAFMASPYINKLNKKMQYEATRLARPLRLILYGNSIPGRTADNTLQGYRLYTFSPLQIDEP